MTRIYYKEAVGAFIVFDVSRPSTFEAVTKWKNDLDSKVSLADGSPVPVVLLANKCDVKKEGPASNPKTLDSFCVESGFVGWYYTSAKENLNIEAAARLLISKILQAKKAFEGDEEPDADILLLNSRTIRDDENKENCSCWSHDLTHPNLVSEDNWNTKIHSRTESESQTLLMTQNEREKRMKKEKGK